MSQCETLEAPAAPAAAPGPWSLGTVFRAYVGRILFTYGLFQLENLLRLGRPWVLGVAINGLIRGSWVGAGLFLVLHVSYLLVSTARRMYDTRAFTSIYTDLATRLVLEQRERGVPLSQIAARSALSRQFVDFFERDVPLVMGALFSVVGAVAMMAAYDWVMVPLCLGLLVPVALVNTWYSRKTLRWSRGLHDELEREVDVIEGGRPEGARGHYGRVAGWRVRLSDGEALNFGATEVFVLGLLVTALVRSCSTPDALAGDIFALFGYVLMFVGGLDVVPMLVQQANNLRDIGRRVRGDEGPSGEQLAGPAHDLLGVLDNHEVPAGS